MEQDIELRFFCDGYLSPFTEEEPYRRSNRSIDRSDINFLMKHVSELNKIDPVAPNFFREKSVNQEKWLSEESMKFAF